MNRDETISIIRLVRVACPQQMTQMDDAGPVLADVWHSALADIDVTDAGEAVKALVRQDKWIAPSDIRRTVHAAQSDRLRRLPPLPAPDADPDDPDAWRAALVAQRTAAAAQHPHLKALT